MCLSDRMVDGLFLADKLDNAAQMRANAQRAALDPDDGIEL